jgi:ABC-2 type transport system permease protein
VIRRSDLALGSLWLRARLRVMIRTPRATFFTFVFPLILLLLLDSIGSGTISVPGGKVAYAQYITPSIAIFALTAATYTSVIFGVATAREQGVFKRVRGTPLPMGVFLGSWVASTVVAALAAVTLMFVVAVPAFGVDVRPELLPAAVVTLLLGGLAFAALGFAIGSFIRRADTAPVIANLTLFPLLFVSGVFYSTESAPHWLQRIADVFPLSHVVHAFTACFSPYTTGSGFSSSDLTSLLAWGIAGTFVAVRRFSREATDEEGGRGGRPVGGVIGRLLPPPNGRESEESNPAVGRSR